MASPGQPPKTMSSRLMGMKFMQRGAASPKSQASLAENESPAKKQKLANGSPKNVQTPDQKAFEASIAAEDAKRDRVLTRLAEEAGDTKWVLEPTKPSKSPNLRVVNAGYNTIDARNSAAQSHEADVERDDTAAMQVTGRKSYGKFNKTIEKQQNPDLSSSSSEEEGEGGVDSSSHSSADSDEEGDDKRDEAKSKRPRSSSVADDIRAKKAARRKHEKQEAAQLAARRRGKDIKLNKLTSISSGGGNNGSRKSLADDDSILTCFSCGKTGHRKADCPKRRR